MSNEKPVRQTPEQILQDLFCKPESTDWYKPVLKAMNWFSEQELSEANNTIRQLTQEVEKLKGEQATQVNYIDYCSCTASTVTNINGKFFCNNCNKEYK